MRVLFGNGPGLTTVAADIRYGVRTLLRTPSFAIAAVLTLALGIGANTTIFSVINSTILKPVPFPASDRLVLVWETFGKAPNNENIVSAPNVWDFRKQTHSFEGIAIFDSSGRGYNLSSTAGEPEQVSGLRVWRTSFLSSGLSPCLAGHSCRKKNCPARTTK